MQVEQAFWRTRKGREISHVSLWKDRKANSCILRMWNIQDNILIKWVIRTKRRCISAVKRDALLKTGFVKAIPFVSRRYTKGVPLLQKMLYYRTRVTRGLDFGVETPVKNFIENPSPSPRVTTIITRVNHRGKPVECSHCSTVPATPTLTINQWLGRSNFLHLFLRYHFLEE